LKKVIQKRHLKITRKKTFKNYKKKEHLNNAEKGTFENHGKKKTFEKLPQKKKTFRIQRLNEGTNENIKLTFIFEYQVIRGTNKMNGV
jgi:hypothetical protein